jgi:hypothetical protein
MRANGKYLPAAIGSANCFNAENRKECAENREGLILIFRFCKLD